jgi:hypothetical protein
MFNKNSIAGETYTNILFIESMLKNVKLCKTGRDVTGLLLDVRDKTTCKHLNN